MNALSTFYEFNALVSIKAIPMISKRITILFSVLLGFFGVHLSEVLEIAFVANQENDNL